MLCFLYLNLCRCHCLLHNSGRAGIVGEVYFFQTTLPHASLRGGRLCTNADCGAILYSCDMNFITIIHQLAIRTNDNTPT